MSLFKITFYVPESHLESVKMAMFAAGAGKIGNYDQCAWQVKGLGQFRPLSGSDAYIGDVGQLETLDEYRVEMVCEADYIKAVVKAMKEAHPYEEPAFDILQTVEIES